MKNAFKRVNARILSCIKRSYADGVLRMRVSLDAAFQTWRSGQKERDGGRRRRGSPCQGPEAGNAEARQSNVSQRWAPRGVELAWVLQGEKGLGQGGFRVLGRGAERVKKTVFSGKKPWGTALGVRGVILDFWDLKNVIGLPMKRRENEPRRESA